MIVLGILAFALLVILHEIGHFVVARRNGVEVEEFGIGFPPKLWGKVMGKGKWRTEYSFNALPLGGFVRLKGESDSDKRDGSLGAATFSSKVRILLAGVGMNYLVAILLISVVAAMRMPVLFDGQFTVSSDTRELRREVVVGAVVENSPAARAGIQQGDVLLLVNGEPVDQASELSSFTRSHAGEVVEISVGKSNGGIEKLSVTLSEQPADGTSYLGVGPQDIIERRSTWSAPIVGFVVTNQLALETLKLLGQAVASLVGGDTTSAAAGVTGPIGIVAILRNVANISQLLLLTGVISLSLALMNALPIPALDGGRLALSAVFRLIRRPLPANVENAVHNIGFILLIGLVIVISIVDVKRFF